MPVPFSAVLLRYYSYAIRSPLLKCLDLYPELIGLQGIPKVVRWSHLPNSRIFSSPQKESRHLLAVPPHPPSPYLVPGNHSLPLVSVDFPVLDILYKWNHIIDGLLRPAFTWYKVFPLFPCDQHFIPFYGQVILHFNGYTTFCLSIRHLMGIWAISAFWVL